MNPVSTRIELGCLGLMGTFWIGASLFYPNPIACSTLRSTRRIFGIFRFRNGGRRVLRLRNRPHAN
jgi:hypothetical protein